MQCESSEGEPSTNVMESLAQGLAIIVDDARSPLVVDTSKTSDSILPVDGGAGQEYLSWQQE